MTGDPTPGAGLAPADDRRVALALHAMTAADRAWMLARLPAEARGQLHEWLDELVSLGVPREPSLLDTVRDGLPPAGARADSVHAAMIRRVDSLSPELLADILRHEPVPLVVALLGISDWTWRQPVMQLLGASHARRIAEAAMTAPMARGRARDAALLQVLLDRAAANRPASVQPGHGETDAVQGRARRHVAGLVALFARKAAT